MQEQLQQILLRLPIMLDPYIKTGQNFLNFSITGHHRFTHIPFKKSKKTLFKKLHRRPQGFVFHQVEKIDPGVSHAGQDVPKSVQVADDYKGQQKAETNFPCAAVSLFLVFLYPVSKQNSEDH